MPTILDGTGSGRAAKVTNENRLRTAAVIESITEHLAKSGNTYNVNTGIITLTNSNTCNGLLYLKNNETADIIVTQFIYLLGNCTCGAATDDVVVQVTRNPTAGTVIDDACTQAPVNLNFGSSNTLTVDSYKASASGKTITDGTVVIESIFPSNGRFSVPVSVRIPKGSSVGIRLTTRTSNSSQDVQIAMAMYLDVFDND